MEEIQRALEASLEDFAISRSERKELKALLQAIQGNTAEQAIVRKLAYRLATKVIGEIGEPASMEWLEGVIKLLYASENEIKSDAYFSPGEDCLHRIRRFIAESQRTLDICVFTITDNRIVERLEQAHQRGVKIRVISDDDKSEDLGSDLEHLSKYGIECVYDRTSAHMHHKFAISDGIKLLNGSYNWTRAASTENNENITVTNHPSILERFQVEFDRLWITLNR
ncbi:PLD-like domain-containing protein [Rubritalea squalenifaciens DSM 18772]|uniref:phospholipase D n=1 Tax=Rubritalea squalenifaciens DSM 18772 TaxID=1123071 RepID=A0A1M6I5A1_9BACT|nr:phospholipase D-like domain-containing protein [Rubritalea squalenifaciens]SHJ29580.1 PLD-like domain-containing protein [Rubritalea squalenifaciens DSM 18772]